MTVDTTDGGALAVPDDELTGLEDFDLGSEGVVPRLSIDHDDARWAINISEDLYPKLHVVMLGLVKQRVLWPAKMGDGKEGPLCKSVNAQIGNPDPDRFPWAEAQLDRAVYEPTLDQRGNLNLPCANCNLKEWGTHPLGDTPWCALQFTIPLVLNMNVDDERNPVLDDPNWMPAVISFSKTALRPVRNFLTPFSASKKPLYTEETLLSLQLVRKAGRSFAVPTLSRIRKTDSDEWEGYSDTLRNMRAFLLTPPTRNRDDDGTATTPPAPAPAPAASAPASAPRRPAAPSAPARAAAPVPAAADDDEPPF